MTEHEPRLTAFYLLSDGDLHLITAGLNHLAADTLDQEGGKRAHRLRDRLLHGDEYVNPKDQYVRQTLLKRLHEQAAKKIGVGLEALQNAIIEEMVEEGAQNFKHAATGKTLYLSRKVWARIAREGKDATDAEKAAAMEALREAGLGDYVAENFNVNSLSAHFREEWDKRLQAERDKPEDERLPLTIEDILPEPLAGKIDLSDAPSLNLA